MDEIHDGRFAGAGRADDCYEFAGFRLERYIRQHWLPRIVGKAHVLDLYMSGHVRQDHRIGSIPDLGLCI